MKYQVGTVAPWWFKTFIFRRKNLQTPVLYRFGDVAGDESSGDVSLPREDEHTIEKQV